MLNEFFFCKSEQFEENIEAEWKEGSDFRSKSLEDQKKCSIDQCIISCVGVKNEFLPYEISSLSLEVK